MLFNLFESHVKHAFFKGNLVAARFWSYFDIFKSDLASLRTGRANVAMLDIIKVDVYGQMMPIEQLATISVPEARLISIQVWDKANTTIIDSAIQKSELGIMLALSGSVNSAAACGIKIIASNAAMIK